MLGSNLKANARVLMQNNAPKLFFVAMLYILLVSILSELAYRLPGSIDIPGMYQRLSAGEMPSVFLMYSTFRPTGVILAILLNLFRPIFNVGFICYCIKITRSRDAGFKDIFDGFQYLIKCITIFIIISALIILWSLLLVIPGIVAAYRYRLSYYILLDDPGKGAIECIKESASIMHGGKLDLFIIDLSFLGWIVLDMAIVMLSPLPYMLPIVQIWLEPYRGLTYAGFYEYRMSGLTV